MAGEKTVPGKLQEDWPAGSDNGNDGVIGGDEFFFTDLDVLDLVFADELIRPPAHALGFGMFVGFPIDDDASVKNASVFIEFPPTVVVSDSGVLGAC